MAAGSDADRDNAASECAGGEVAIDKEELKRLKKRRHNEKRAKLGDYKHDAKLHSVMSMAIDIMKVKLSTISPFPPQPDREAMAKEAFDAALKAFSVTESEYVMDVAQRKLVSIATRFLSKLLALITSSQIENQESEVRSPKCRQKGNRPHSGKAVRSSFLGHYRSGERFQPKES